MARTIQDLPTTQLNGQPILTTNRLINGAMSIDRRNSGALQSIPATSVLTYTVDRWFCYAAGAAVSGQRANNGFNGGYFYNITGASGNTGVGFGQRVTRDNSLIMAGKQIYCQAKMQAPAGKIVTWTASGANALDTFGTILAPNKTLVAKGEIVGKGYKCAYYFDFFLPTGTVLGGEILFTVPSLVDGEYLGFTDIQIEPDQSSVFQTSNDEFNLDCCKQYYSIFNGTTISGYGGVGTPCTYSYPSPNVYRSPSVASFGAITYTNCALTNIVADSVGLSITLTSTALGAFSMVAPLTSGFTADAELYL